MSGPRASASCEVWIDGQQIACTRDELFAGQPTILDPLVINWGRRGAWDQPDAGSSSFVIRDQRTAPQPIVDTIHVGSKIDVFAEAPNPDPVSQVVMDQDFESVPTSGGLLSDRWWALEQIASTTKRTNLYTDPSCTTITGKGVSGSAVLATDAAWAIAGTTSIKITPNGSSSLSAMRLWTTDTVLNGFTPGSTYIVSATIRLTAAQTGTINADARRLLAMAIVAGVPTPIGTSAQAANAAGVTRLSISFTVPAGATGMNIRLMNGSSAATSLVWWDGILLQTGSALDVYFDGTTTRTGYTYAWTGTANASTSTEAYAVTDPDSDVVIYTSVDAPTGQGSRSALLNSEFTRARFLFPPAAWGGPWVRDLRPIVPGETWTYSFMARLPAGTTATASTLGFSSSQSDGATIMLPMSGGVGGFRQIVGTGNWETYTGTIVNSAPPNLPRWPVFALLVFPEAQNYTTLTPAVDAITYTAPPLITERVQVWAGRVTELEAQRAVSRTAIEIQVTATGELAEVENVSIGDDPWTTEISDARIDRIISLIPLPVEDFSASRDVLNWEFVAERDIDAQPALGLLRDYASMVLGVVWPISVPGARNHAWIENTLNRVTGWNGPAGQLSACNVPREAVRISQTADQVITVADVTWLELVTDPISGESDFVERTESTVDMAASAIYGARRLGLQTEFVSISAAQRTGDLVMDSARASDWGVSGMQFDTKHVDNTDGQAQLLLMLLLNSARRPGSWLTINDLPEWMPVSIASGFVEGGSITYTGGRWRFDLTMSAGGSGS